MGEKKTGKKYKIKPVSPKGRHVLSKAKAKGKMSIEKTNRETYNRADNAMNDMINNKGIPRIKIGF